jgi:hypothetical protein
MLLRQGPLVAASFFGVSVFGEISVEPFWAYFCAFRVADVGNAFYLKKQPASIDQNLFLP